MTGEAPRAVLPPPLTRGGDGWPWRDDAGGAIPLGDGFTLVGKDRSFSVEDAVARAVQRSTFHAPGSTFQVPGDTSGAETCVASGASKEEPTRPSSPRAGERATCNVERGTWNDAPDPFNVARGTCNALPRLTIVTPSFNQGKYLEQTIRSVLLQGYPKLEYIVIDGGSTDNSVQIIRHYEPWLAYWVSEPDRGQSDAINKGFARATGEIGNWLNSDDYYLSWALWEIAEAWGRSAFNVQRSTCHVPGATCNDLNVERGTTGPLLCGDVIDFVDGDPARPLKYVHQENINLTDFVCYWRERCMWHQPGIFFPVELFRQVGGLDENLWMSMDMDLMCRFLTRTSAVCLDIPLVMFRLHPKAKTQQMPYRHWVYNRPISMRYWKDLPEPVNRREFRDTFCRHCIGMASNLYRDRRWGELREMLTASFSESPWTTLRLLLERGLPGRSRD